MRDGRLPEDDHQARRTEDTILADLVAEALELDSDDLSPDADLRENGLDSIRLMSLAGRLRKSGVAVTFKQLADEPTLRAWQRLVDTAEPAPAPASAAPRTSAPTEPFDLGLMQHAFWIGRQDGQPLGGVGAHFYVELDGNGINPERLGHAVVALRRRHPMLRTTVLGDGRQQITPETSDHANDPSHAITVHDFTAAEPAFTEARLAELRDSNTHRRMDVERGEVLDVALSLLPDSATRLHIDLDMVAADALSMRILLADLRSCYVDADAELPALGIDYAGYLSARRSERADDRERDRQWWLRQLPGLAAPPRLPVVVDPHSTDSADEAYRCSARVHRWLSPDEKAALYERARRHRVSPAAVVATAFAEILAGWSGEQRFLLNLPLFDRDGAELLVGDFSGSVLVDVDLRNAEPFSVAAQRVATATQEAIAHSAFSGIEVLREMTRANGGAPALAPVVYTSAIGLGEIYTREVQQTFGEPVWMISQNPQVLLDAQVTELDDGLLLNWDYREQAFAPGVVPAAFAAFEDLIRSLTTVEDTWARPVSSLVPEEQMAQRRRVNATDGPRPAASLHGPFFRLAEQQPDRAAVVWDGGRLGYGELSLRARRLATGLIERGVRPGDTVAITLPKGLDQVVAVLGVLAAGAAYVPIGVDHPEPRRARIRASARVSALVTDAAHRPGEIAVPVLEPAQTDRLDPAEPVDGGPDALAYVIFTSGSTGEPKGVEVSHGAVVNTITAVAEEFDVGADDRTIALSALDFDLSAYDLFAFLRTGGSVVLIGEDERRDAHRWAALIDAHRVSVVSCVPALLDMLLSAASELPDSLRLVMLGGDWVGLDLPGRLRGLVPGARFVALGGMTEAAIHTTVFEVDDVDPDWRSIPYGVPLRNMSARVVDGRGRDCPDWVPGELWVSGAGLARGYRGDPERTASKFVEHDGRRWYRTGDLARYTAEGILEFLGRADHQVKIRGHRIELGEVEAMAAAHPAVSAAVASVVTEPARRLALMATGDLTEAQLADWLTGQLPPHLVPDRLLIGPIPLTANGKLDRTAVAALAASAVDEQAVAEPPTGPVERLVATVFAEVLGVAEPSRDDSFFALGGDSLLATRAVARLRGTGATVGQLFAKPVLREFAATLTTSTTTGTEPATTIPADLASRHEPFPATDVQRAYWIGRDPRLPLGGVGTHHYTEFDGIDVDLDRLERAWQRLINRHEMLRAVFDEDGDQRILASTPPFRIPVDEADDPSSIEEALQAWRDEHSHRLFDLTQWPLFSVRALRYRAGDTMRTRIAVSLDYTVLDARSIMTLFDELDRCYRDPYADLAPIDVSFRDYVITVRAERTAVGAAAEHWRRRLDDLPPAPALPRTGTTAPPRFTRREHVLSPQRWQVLAERARAHDLTASAVLLACYGDVLAAYSGQAGVAVTLTVFDREPRHPHIDRVLGDFTSFSVYGHRSGADADWLDRARRAHRTLGEDLEHPAPAGWLLSELGRHADTVAAAVPVVFTSAVGLGDAAPDTAFGNRVYGLSQSPQVLLDNQITERVGGSAITWDAVEEQFPDGLLDAMFDAYRRMVDALVDDDWTQPRPNPVPSHQLAVRAEANDTARAIPPEPLHAPFFRAARQWPDAAALAWHDGELTYSELADRTLRIAGTLRVHGVTGGDVVGISLPKGPEQIAAVLGVLAAGAAYVPIGVDQPQLRRERMRDVAAVAMIIDEQTRFSADPLPAPVLPSPDDLAYLIFTSGSTGDPKAVAITHRAAHNTVADVADRFGLDENDKVLAVSALDFDLSVFDIFGLLGAGGALILPREDERRDPPAWLRLMDRHRVTVWNSAPMLLDLLLTATDLDTSTPAPRRLRLALLSGDWIGLDLPPRLRHTAPDCRFIAMGGATEASIWSNVIEVGDVPATWTSIPYGRPLANQKYRVVDDLGRDCPDWTAGELWIGGTGVAAGYRGATPDDDARFVTHDGERWYRTGDRGRYWPDGTLEFLGRDDQQVKVSGHRIELGEIETALSAHPKVGRAVVLVEGERGRRRLAAVVSPDLPADLADHLAQRLPAHAVPARIAAVSRIPLTRNGKVDRPALSELVGRPDREAEPPTGETEQLLAALWSEHLGTPATDRHVHFFAAGGNSLAALRFVSAASEALGIELSVPDFLRTPTLAGLAGEADRLRRARLTEESGVV